METENQSHVIDGSISTSNSRVPLFWPLNGVTVRNNPWELVFFPDRTQLKQKYFGVW